MKEKRNVVLAIMALVLGGLIGLMIGVYANYGVAELFADTKEAQAYFTLIVIPTVGLIGAGTGLFGALILWKRWFAIPAGLGVLMLIITTVLGVRFSWNHRPAEFRVENRTNVHFEQVFLGGDFRRSTRVGSIAPGASSRAIRVNLDTPGTYNKINGNAGDGYVRHGFYDAQDLPNGDYRIVVSGEPPFNFELRREDN